MQTYTQDKIQFLVAIMFIVIICINQNHSYLENVLLH